MHVITVIPLTRGTHAESLSYYSGAMYPTGTIIEVPIRKSAVPALVLDSQPVSAAKTAVRAATFTLRKLPEQTADRRLPDSLIATATELQNIYPASLGALLFSLLPPEVRTGEINLESTSTNGHPAVRPEIDILEGTFDTRFMSYRSKIREVFAHRGSVLLVVPTAADIDRAREHVSAGIENRVVVFSPALTKKKMMKAHEAFGDLTAAKLIITTPSHAYLDRHDLTHIIIEQSRSRHYRGNRRPYLDHRDGLKALAKVTNRTMTLGDILPRSEEEQLRRHEVYATLDEHPKRLNFSSTLKVITQTDAPSAQQPFALIDPAVETAIRDTTRERQRVFVYAARRGLAPVVVCVDCGYIFRCPDSGAPYALFRTKSGEEEERWFLSQASGKRVRAADTCTACGSWRLRERGIGIQYLETELRALFPEVPLMLFDHTSATTYKKARAIVGQFYDTKGAILLGTQMALPYLETPVTTTVVTSHDATRAIPSWRAEEEFFGLLLTLRERTTDTVYLQTRTEPDSLLEYAAQGAVEKFYTEELELREVLHYPPYTVFILLTFQGTKENILKVEADLEKLLAPYHPRFYSAPQSIVTKTKRFGLIRIPQNEWPRADLLRTLRSLPPNIKIEINPDRIV